MESGILNEAFLHDDEFGDAKKSEPYFNFFLGYRLKKGQKSAISAIYGLTVFKEFLFDTQKMLSGS